MMQVVNEALQISDSPIQGLQTSGNVSLRRLSEVAFSIPAFLNCHLRSSVTGTPKAAQSTNLWVHIQLNMGEIFK